MSQHTESTSAPSSGWADSAEQWAQRKRHNVVLPSGQKAVIEIPMLGPLVLGGAVPDDLAELARTEITHELGLLGAYAGKVAELAKAAEPAHESADGEKAEAPPEGLAELTTTFNRLLKWLVSEHVLVEPKLTVEELSDERFPLEDLDWLYGVAMRRVDEDALGRRLGVAPLDAFATFRRLHGCTEDCEGCRALLDAFSTADLGAL